MGTPPSDLTAKLKASDLEVQRYVVALQNENLKLHTQIAKHQANEVSLNNRIEILKENQKDTIDLEAIAQQMKKAGKKQKRNNK